MSREVPRVSFAQRRHEGLSACEPRFEERAASGEGTSVVVMTFVRVIVVCFGRVVVVGCWFGGVVLGVVVYRKGCEVGVGTVLQRGRSKSVIARRNERRQRMYIGLIIE